MNHINKYAILITFCTSLINLNLKAEVISIKAKRIINAPITLNSENDIFYKQNSRILDNLLPGQMANGSSKTIFARGLETYHTKVEIDSIEANDPSAPNKSFNFNFTPSTINGSFQYLGPESNIYSSGLSASTVLYDTSTNLKNKNQINFSNGSYNQNKFSATVNNKIEVDNKILNSISYNLLANFDEAGGRDFSQDNGDKDGYNKKDYHAVIAGDLLRTHFKLVAHSFDYLENLDGNINPNGQYVEDPNRSLKSDIGLFGVFLENAISDRLTHKISYSKNRTIREEINPSDNFNNEVGSKEKYKGSDNWIKNSLNLEDSENSYFLEAQLNFGSESSYVKNEWQEFETNYSKTLYGIKGQKEFGSAYIFAGTTLLKRQSTRAAENYSVGPGFNLGENVSAQLQMSRNEEVPSLFQLNAPTYGNKFLSNEIIKSRSLSLIYKNEKTKIKFTPFISQIENRFSFNPETYQSTNSGEAQIWGIQNEFFTSWKILYFNLNSIYQKTKDKKTGKQLLRRAPFSTIESVVIMPSDLNSIGVSHTFKGKRDEFQGTLPSYNKWDLNIGHKIDDFVISLTIENFLNSKYQDTFETLPSERTFLGSIVWKI